MSTIQNLIKSQQKVISNQMRILVRLERLAAKRSIFVKKCENIDDKSKTLLKPNNTNKRKLFYNNTRLSDHVLDILEESDKQMSLQELSSSVKKRGYKTTSNDFSAVIYQICLKLNKNGLIIKSIDKITKRVKFSF